MHLHHPIHPRGGTLLKLLLFVVLLGLCMIIAAGAVIHACFRPDREFRDLRNSLLQELPGPAPTGFSVRAPSLLVALGRVGSRFLNDLDEEARLAIRTVRGAQAGLYQLDRPLTRTEMNRIVAGAGQTMSRHHWSRVAAIIGTDHTVLTYTPKDADDPRDLRLLSVVITDDAILIASARGDLHPAFQLLQRVPPFGEREQAQCATAFNNR